MDLSTTYLGMRLKSPLVPSASPLSESVDNIRKMEDAGAAAVVLHSLFAEQLAAESEELDASLSHGTESFAESLSYLPEPAEFHVGPEGYLEHIRRAKEAVGIPVIASLNGSTPGSWTAYAREMEWAGADALELNIYRIPVDPGLSPTDVEQSYLDILEEVTKTVTIPVAVKLAPYFSNLANMASRLASGGAAGLVLFNRFYQPDLDIEALDVAPRVALSQPHEQRLPLRWIAILYGRVHASLAATTGIHSAEDVLKMLMAGADVTMLCSSLLMRGIEHLRTLEADMRRWMEDHEYESVEQMKGSLSQKGCGNPAAFERCQYVRTLQSYRVS